MIIWLFFPEVIFDRIEAGTYLIAAAITEGDIKIKNVNPSIIKTEINTLKRIGAKIKSYNATNYILIAIGEVGFLVNL